MAIKDLKALYPHSDSRVLHAPTLCLQCDKYPELQEARLSWYVNFTGHSRPEFSRCPSEIDDPVMTKRVV